MKKIISLLLLLSCIHVYATEIAVQRAMRNAQNFIEKKSSKNVKTSNLLELKLTYTATENGKACFYVFNNNNGGFVIASGDDIATEILAYSDHGTFDYATINPNFKWWLEQYQKQIAFVRDNGIQTTVVPKTETRADVPILITTRWDQGIPYNNEIYNQTEHRYLTGCVATTMSQVMNYHEWPVTGIGSKTYTDDVSSGKTFTTDFSAHTYDWANMANTYSSTSTQAQKDAVAQLMYDAGVSVEMQYGTSSQGGSGAYSEYISYALVNYFGYDKGARIYYRDYCTDAEWSDLLYTELSAGRPVMYGGVDAYGAGGHSFICDGYESSTDQYHFNWGWSGSGDCYCSLSAIKGSGYNWQYYQDAVVGIQKPIESSVCVPYIGIEDQGKLIFTTTEKDGLTTYNVNFDKYSYYGICNLAWMPFDMVFTMKYTNQETGEVYYATFAEGTTPEKVSFPTVYGNIINGKYCIPSLKVKDVVVPKLPNGKYHVTLACKEYADLDKTDESLWKEVPTYKDFTNYQELYVESTMETPVATNATDINDNGFTANWNKTSDATSYILELTTQESGSGTTGTLLNESFIGFDDTTSDGTADISGKLDTYMQHKGWTGSKVFASKSRVKLGSSSAGGTLTTPTLNAEGKINVIIGENKYNTDNTKITVTIGTIEKTFSINGTEHNIEAEVSGDFKVQISTSGSKQRAYINKVVIENKGCIISRDTIQNITDNKYVFDKLSKNYDYSYRIQATNEDEVSKWSNSILVEMGGGPEPEPTDTCATPTISYDKGVLSFACETEGAECYYTLVASDTKATTTAVIDGNVILDATYLITFYAKAKGYVPSKTANALLCWLDEKPQPIDPTEIITAKSTPVIITNNGGTITITGLAEYTSAMAYLVDGKMLAVTKVKDGSAILHTNLKSGDIVVLRIGKKSIKMQLQ